MERRGFMPENKNDFDIQYEKGTDNELKWGSDFPEREDFLAWADKLNSVYQSGFNDGAKFMKATGNHFTKEQVNALQAIISSSYGAREGASYQYKEEMNKYIFLIEKMIEDGSKGNDE